MKAAWYGRNGEAKDVLTVGEQPTPKPAAGEVLVRLHTSGVNPSDVKSRRGRPLTMATTAPMMRSRFLSEPMGKTERETPWRSYEG